MIFVVDAATATFTPRQCCHWYWQRAPVAFVSALHVLFGEKLLVPQRVGKEHVLVLALRRNRRAQQCSCHMSPFKVSRPIIDILPNSKMEPSTLSKLKTASIVVGLIKRLNIRTMSMGEVRCCVELWARDFLHHLHPAYLQADLSARRHQTNPLNPPRLPQWIERVRVLQ